MSFYNPTNNKSGVSKKFPFSVDGVEVTIEGYSFENNALVLELKAVENGAPIRKKLFAPSKDVDKFTNNLAYLGDVASSERITTVPVETFEDFAHMIFGGREFPNSFLVKPTYASDNVDVDEAKIAGKTKEEIKAIFSPFINISMKGSWWKKVDDEKFQFSYAKPGDQYYREDDKYKDITDYTVTIVNIQGDRIPLDEYVFPETDSLGETTGDDVPAF